MINVLQNGIGSVFKKISENLCVSAGRKFPPGSLKLSLVIVAMVGAQLLLSVSISRAVIFLLLMTSGDVERNPGPTQSGIHCFIFINLVTYIVVHSCFCYPSSYQSLWSYLQNNCFDDSPPTSYGSCSDHPTYEIWRCGDKPWPWTIPWCVVNVWNNN